MESLPDEMLNKIVSYIPSFADRKILSESYSKLWYSNEIIKHTRFCLNYFVETDDECKIVECDETIKNLARNYKSFKFYIDHNKCVVNDNLFNIILKCFEENCSNHRINYLSIKCKKLMYVLIEFDAVICESTALNSLVLDSDDNHFAIFPKCKTAMVKIINHFFHNNIHTLNMNQIRSCQTDILELLKDNLVNLQIEPTVNNNPNNIVSTYEHSFAKVLQEMPKLKYVNFQRVDFWGICPVFNKYDDTLLSPYSNIQKFEYNLPCSVDIYYILPLLVNCKILKIETKNVNSLLNILNQFGVGILKHVKNLRLIKTTKSDTNDFSIDLSIFESIELLDISMEFYNFHPLRLLIKLPQKIKMIGMYINNEDILLPINKIKPKYCNGQLLITFKKAFNNFKCIFHEIV